MKIMSKWLLDSSLCHNVTVVHLARVLPVRLVTWGVCFRFDFKPKKIKTENDKKAKKRKQDDGVSKG